MKSPTAYIGNCSFSKSSSSITTLHQRVPSHSVSSQPHTASVNASNPGFGVANSSHPTSHTSGHTLIHHSTHQPSQAPKSQGSKFAQSLSRTSEKVGTVFLPVLLLHIGFINVLSVAKMGPLSRLPYR